MTGNEWDELSISVSTVFTPAAPVDEQQLFAGRIEQLRQVVDVVNQKGQHAIIFGERGVGKTSLANVIVKKFGSDVILALRKNCDSSDDYSSLWKKIFSEMKLAQGITPIGFMAQTSLKFVNPTEYMAEEISPDNVRQILTLLSEQYLPIVVIDEFDRISKTEVKAAMADTIKTLSDHAVRATLILVGVADSVEQLMKEHQSVERAMVQIKMPRMSNAELGIIIDNGLQRLGMTIDVDAKKQITLLSQGLPHYTHLLGLHSVRQAIDNKTKNINMGHVDSAIAKALEQAQLTILTAYHKAITSPRKDTLFEQVLLACAVAKTDDLGYFAAADVREPLSKIMGKNYEIPSFSRHLNDFCDVTRGSILHKIGVKRRYRFRFVNPLMQPFVTMQGFVHGLIDRQKIELLK
jgi:Cdc6-like AAA superfamily ATPase